jgi:hypothetical protein
MWVGGAGVTAGYLGRPELTAGRFLPDPWAGEPGARMYRSGDLGRYLADGDLEYLGRIDHQVKIRGFRIELGEIEAAVTRHPAVREAVVLALEAGPAERRLVAFVGAEPDGEAPSLSDLRAFLAPTLPDYMLPAGLVPLAALPLTGNGKVDRAALARRGAAAAGTATPGEAAPRTELERFLVRLWSEHLRVERVGIEDNFFELGGNSLSAAVLVNRLQQELQETVELVTIFDAPTVGRLAAHLVDRHPTAVERIWGQESLGEAAARAGQEPAPKVDAGKVDQLRALIRKR